MKLRKAVLTDEEAVLALYREAQAFLAAQGIDQWQDGYPNRETFLADVGRGGELGPGGRGPSGGHRLLGPGPGAHLRHHL